MLTQITDLPVGEGSRWCFDLTKGYFDRIKFLKEKTIVYYVYLICTCISSQVIKVFIRRLLAACFQQSYPQVWSLVDGPKSTYIPSLSPSHMPRSLFPRKGFEASLSRSVITSASVTQNNSHAWTSMLHDALKIIGRNSAAKVRELQDGTRRNNHRGNNVRSHVKCFTGDVIHNKVYVSLHKILLVGSTYPCAQITWLFYLC